MQLNISFEKGFIGYLFTRELKSPGELLLPPPSPPPDLQPARLDKNLCNKVVHFSVMQYLSPNGCGDNT